MHGYKVITATVLTPIDVDAELKRHCAIDPDNTDDDTLLTGYVKAARNMVENYIGYPLMVQTVEMDMGDNPELELTLTSNVTAITQYTYEDEDEVDQDVTASASLPTLNDYKNPCTCKIDEWPTGTNFRIRMTAGWTQALTPDDIKHAVRLLVSHMYEYRDPKIQRMPDTVEYRLNPYVIYG